MKHLLAGYDEADIFAHEVDYQMEQANTEGEPITKDEAISLAYNAYDLFSDEWGYFTETLTELLQKKAHDGNAWRVIGKELGWRKLNGYKYTLADTATKLLQAMLPETDCTISVYNYKNGYQVQASHHDAPMGESYFVTPCALSTYEKNS